MILITGASGHIGRRVAELLAERRQRLRLMARDPAKVPKLPDTQAVPGDYTDPASLNAAFDGVDVAFVVSGYAEPERRARLHKNAFDAAARAGVKHVVYLSFQSASPDSKFPMARDHYLSEQYLKRSGIPYTALRDNLYMDIVPEMFGADGVLRAPAAQGAAAWVAREDVARVAAAVLNAPGASNAAYDVTGPEALTLAETARRLSALGGRELRYESETVEEGRKWRSQLGAPDWEVDTWLGSYLAIAAGELAQTSDTVYRLTGRAPYRFEGYFSERPRLLDGLGRPSL